MSEALYYSFKRCDDFKHERAFGICSFTPGQTDENHCQSIWLDDAETRQQQNIYLLRTEKN